MALAALRSDVQVIVLAGCIDENLPARISEHPPVRMQPNPTWMPVEEAMW